MALTRKSDCCKAGHPSPCEASTRRVSRSDQRLLTTAHCLLTLTKGATSSFVVAGDSVVTDLGDLGRLEEPSLLVLISLSSGAKHGYGIQTDVREFDGRSLGPGTLYAILPRLERLGLIEALPPEDRRRPYRITTAGAEVLRAHLSRLHTLTQAGLARLEAVG